MGRAYDLIGKRFGKLLVVARSTDVEKERKNKTTYWVCDCDCGNKNLEFSRVSLLKRESCGCISVHATNLTGMKFNRLFVIKRVGTNSCKKPVWQCLCDCGNITEATSQNIVSGITKSCGCFKKEKMRATKQDLTGQKFGRLLVLRESKERKYGKIVWDCKCECGVLTSVTANALKRGSTASCGCVGLERLKSWTGENHPNWKGLSLISRYLRDHIVEWKKKSVVLCDYKCAISNGKFDVIHHLYPFSQIVFETSQKIGIELNKKCTEYTQYEIDYIIDCFLKEHSKYFYGVCLKKEIHDEFHIKYGTIGFTSEDFYEFYNCKTGRVFDPSFLMPQNIENQERKCLNGL